MAPQTSIPLSANVLGTIGTVFWCIQLVPQIWYNWKQKKTDGLPGFMMFIWAVSAVPFGVYAIVQNFNIPIQIQPQIFCMLALVSWSQILIYNHAWPVWKASLLAAGLGALFGGLQVLLVLTLRGPYSRGVEWPMTLVGVISAILLAGGLIPPYFEIWKRSGRVVGISKRMMRSALFSTITNLRKIDFIFLSIDWMGAFFSLMALVAQHTFDVLGGVQYLVCSLLLEFGIFTSHVLFLLRTRSLRRRAKDLEIPFDSLPEARRFVFPRPDESGEHSTAEAPVVELDGERDAEIGKTLVDGKEGGERERGRMGSGSTPAVGRWPSRQ
ncbi:MAG: hypothetical protein Q9222_006656 [Ikaeria aurantiellina]